MENLLALVERLKKSDVRAKVDARLAEFREAGGLDAGGLFSELCFCLLTANFSAEKSIRIQKECSKDFHCRPAAALAKRLRALGHRFPNARAGYIAEARKWKGGLCEKLASATGPELRDWLVKNVKGLGMKEASHFLRNVGRTGLAIIDFHIIDILVRHGLIERPKTLTRKKYLEVEGVLREISKKTGLSLAALDLYLWFAETGKVLK